MSNPIDINGFEFLTAWETSRWLGVDVLQVLAGWEDRTIPPPRSLCPLRWHEADLIEHCRSRLEANDIED